MKTFTVSEDNSGRRLDSWLAEISGQSRSHWQKLLDAGLVSVNNTVAVPRYLVKAGDKVTVTEKKSKPEPAAVPQLKIIYEDEDVLVINKPAGLLAHDTPGGTGEATVAGFAATKSADSDKIRPGIVHRLDRDTSGVMIIAKNTAAKNFLQKKFKERHAQKVYIALVVGRLKQPEAVIDLPIARQTDTARYTVDRAGKPAETAYHVDEEYRGYSLLTVYPKTGRTHQIRAHFAWLGHPVAGDRLYGGKAIPGLSRQFLHAHKLTITLPSGKKQTFSAPLPSELKAVLAQLRDQVY